MKRSAKIAVLMTGLLVCLLAGPAASNAETFDLPLNLTLTGFVPTYLEGHDGDPNYIAGFRFQSDLFYGNMLLGTYDGEMLLTEPPMDFTKLFDGITFEGTLLFSGIASCSLEGVGITMLASMQGDILVSFAGKLSDCTDSLAGIVGLSTGSGEINLLTTTGQIEFTLQIPLP